MVRQLHHFVPRFYLRQFVDLKKTDRELVWVYERGKEQAGLRSLGHIVYRTGLIGH